VPSESQKRPGIAVESTNSQPQVRSNWRPSREIGEEFEGHIAAAEADGIDPIDARRTFGPTWSRIEASRDVRLIPWLDSVRGDTVFAWRQLKKNEVTAVAAILSIGLAVGACTSAFRLVVLVALLAVTPAMLRAARVDPAVTLRLE
jgi:hypothetical protein